MGGARRYSFLSMTKPSPYSEERPAPEICVSDRRYLFLYPMVKQRRWYGLAPEERGRIMKSHIEVGRRYPEITINTTYSYGIDDQEFVVCFEGDDPGDIPRPRQRAAPDRVERVHRAGDADFLLRGDVGRQGARRPRRHPASAVGTSAPALRLKRRHSLFFRAPYEQDRNRRDTPSASPSSAPDLPASMPPSTSSKTGNCTPRSTSSTACRPRSGWSAAASRPTTRRSSR